MNEVTAEPAEGLLTDVRPRPPGSSQTSISSHPWRVPDPTFAHVWNRSAYLNLVKPPPNAAPSQ